MLNASAVVEMTQAALTSRPWTSWSAYRRAQVLEAQASPRALLGAVVGHLNTVAALLQGSLGQILRRQLSSVAKDR
jgi:hypothetical protein